MRGVYQQPCRVEFISPVDFFFGLVSASGLTVPDPDWVTVDDAISAGVNSVAGAADVILSRSDRLDPLWSGLNVQREFYVVPAAALSWLAVPVGDTVAAVILYNGTSRRIWSWVGGLNVPTDGGDVVYGDTGQQIVFYQSVGA